MKTHHRTTTILLESSIALLFLLPVSVSADSFYADIDIDITDSGFVTIQGTTNHPDLLVNNTPQYTSKIKELWVLNITKNELFSEYIFSLTFPKNTVLYSVDSLGALWIEEQQNHLVVNGFGQNKSLLLSIQYQLTAPTEEIEADLHSIINDILIGAIIVIIILIVVYLVRIKKTKETVGENPDAEQMKGLTERQKAIMILLLESDGPLTQTDIERRLGMPKSAVSRNIQRLKQKDLIDIEKVGMSNRIFVKKQ